MSGIYFLSFILRNTTFLNKQVTTSLQIYSTAEISVMCLLWIAYNISDVRRCISLETRRTFSSELLHCAPTEYHWRACESSPRRRAEKLLKSQEYYVHARLPRCRLINAAESRPASGTLLSLFLSRLLTLHPYLALPTTMTAMRTTAMAQSRCPLAKLKYLAFGRARVKGCTIFANLRRDRSQSLINTGLGATRTRSGHAKHISLESDDKKGTVNFEQGGTLVHRAFEFLLTKAICQLSNNFCAS